MNPHKNLDEELKQVIYENRFAGAELILTTFRIDWFEIGAKHFEKNLTLETVLSPNSKQLMDELTQKALEFRDQHLWFAAQYLKYDRETETFDYTEVEEYIAELKASFK